MVAMVTLPLEFGFSLKLITSAEKEVALKAQETEEECKLKHLRITMFGKKEY